MDVHRRFTARFLFAATLVLCVGCAGPRASSGASVKPNPTHREVALVSVKHTVGKGQTLYRIARTYGLNADELMAANGIHDPRALEVGQQLVIPGAREVLPVEVPSESPVTAPSRAPPASKPVAARVVASPPETKPSPRPPRAAPPVSQLKPGKGSGALDWPLRGVLYGRFGRRGKEPHDGIDLAAPKGTPVRTAGPGRVLFAGEQRGYGKLVIVDHGSDLVTLYAHNHDLRVQAGQTVREGQVIATVGESGRTSGPHLHFEVRRDGLPVDPLAHLGPVPSS